MCNCSFHTKLFCRLLILFPLVVILDNLLQILEHLRARIRIARHPSPIILNSSSFVVRSLFTTLALFIHLFHLTLGLSHGELLCKGQTFRPQLLFFVQSTSLHSSLNLSFLGWAFFTTFLLGKLGTFAKSPRINTEYFFGWLCLPTRYIDRNGVFKK